MSKETFYFSHDYNARSDPKIKRLILNKGMDGYGIFWSIIEDLYNNANALPTDYDCIAFDLHSQSDIIKSIINDFDLFVINDGFFGSLSVERRLSERNDKSEKARQSAILRWSKIKEDANAMRTQCDSNAIKERKEKEKKEKKEKIYSEQAHALFSDLVILFDERLRPKDQTQKDKWLNVCERLLKEHDHDYIKTIVKKARMDSFWCNNFLSLTKLLDNDKNGVKYFLKFELQFNGKSKKINDYDFESIDCK